MKVRVIAIAFPLSCVLAISGFLMSRMAKSQPFGEKPYVIPTRHPVTKEMEIAAENLKRTPAPKFVLSDQNGDLISSDLLKSGKPTLLLFIKDGCPCSIESQPFFNDLAAKFGGDVHFLGIIDGSAKASQNFADANTVPFSILVDPSKSLMKAFKIEASSSFAVIDGKGMTVTVSPGYNKASLRQANFLLGTLSKTGPREFDDADVPEKITAGCAFFSD